MRRSINIGIIPVRGGSTRLPKKNFMDFSGKPMFVYTYQAAKESGLFEDVVVSTDSAEVIAICHGWSIPVPFIRPATLSTATASLDDVCLHALEEMGKRGKEYDNLCLLWATAPLRDATDIQNAYRLLSDQTDAVIGITACTHYYGAQIIDAAGYLQPLVPLFGMTTIRFQDVPVTFVDNGSLAWVRCAAFLREKTWMPKRTRGYMMPRYKSVDVDTPEDLELLSFYYEKYCHPKPLAAT